MCRRVAPRRGDAFFVDADCHPQTIDVVRTRAEPLGIEVVVGDPDADLPPSGVFGVLLQYPGSSGAVRDDRALVDAAPRAGRAGRRSPPTCSRSCCSRPPGEFGADVVVGSAQRFGVPLGFGGPHAGVPRHPRRRQAHPARPAGRRLGRRRGPTGLRLALQTREQHIRREKATSNICTAQVLLAVIAGMYAVYHGPDGLARDRRAGAPAHRGLAAGAARRASRSCTTRSSTRSPCACPAAPTTVLAARGRAGINLRRVDDDTSASRSTRPPPRSTSTRCSARSASTRRSTTSTHVVDASPRRCAAPRRSSPTRCSTRTTPRPRCCATCAGWPTATSRSTAR